MLRTVAGIVKLRAPVLGACSLTFVSSSVREFVGSCFRGSHDPSSRRIGEPANPRTDERNEPNVARVGLRITNYATDNKTQQPDRGDGRQNRHPLTEL